MTIEKIVLRKYSIANGIFYIRYIRIQMCPLKSVPTM